MDLKMSVKAEMDLELGFCKIKYRLYLILEKKNFWVLTNHLKTIRDL